MLAHMRPITGSAIREIFKLLGKPGMISFAGGNPSNAALEPEIISELAVEVLAKYGTTLLQYGATEGFAPLIESAGAFLAEAGVHAGPGELLPVQGGTQGFDLLMKALIEPGDVILAEDPTFLGALQAMHTYNARIIAVATDENGVIPEDVEEKIKKYRPKMMYIIPSFQNPTGVTLSLERRKVLAELACRYGVVLAEDDPYRDLRYAGEALPAIKSFDEEGWVVYLSSFSKYVSPGMRLGAAVGNKTLIAQDDHRQAVHGRAFAAACAGHHRRLSAQGPNARPLKAHLRRLQKAARRHAGRLQIPARGHAPHRPRRRPVRLGGASRGPGCQGHAEQVRGKQRGLCARHILLCGGRPRKHHAPELLQRHH